MGRFSFAHFVRGGRKAEEQPPADDQEKVEGEEEENEEGAAGDDQEQVEGGEGEDEEDAAASARLSERARCAAIFAAPEAAANTALACHLAFETDLPPEAAVGAMRAAAKAAKATGFAAAMQGAPSPSVRGGAAAPSGDDDKAAAAVLTAMGRGSTRNTRKGD